LAGREDHAREHCHRDLRRKCFGEFTWRKDLTVTRRNHYQIRNWIVAPQPKMRSHGIAIGWKGMMIDQDFPFVKTNRRWTQINADGKITANLRALTRIEFPVRRRKL
jgi:hypothetical protein